MTRLASRAELVDLYDEYDGNKIEITRELDADRRRVRYLLKNLEIHDPNTRASTILKRLDPGDIEIGQGSEPDAEPGEPNPDGGQPVRLPEVRRELLDPETPAELSIIDAIEATDDSTIRYYLREALAIGAGGEVESLSRHSTPGEWSGRRLMPLVHRRIRMGTKTVRLDEDVYERIAAHKKEDETFSETIDRLIDDWSLLDLADTKSEEEVARHRELLEESDEHSIEDHEEMLERMGIDAG